ncbi:MAG: hypothetical protein FVQ80_10360 [Planctomycetes bacterium]|nr:hypothetical protein [Planctomycetota bacterium]
MDMFDTMFSQSGHLNEQIARHVFEIIPEGGPVLAIIDREGNCWPSDSERFTSLHIDETFLNDLRSKIDDGDEPIVTQLGEHSVVAVQLCTERTNCGYVLMVLCDQSPESTMKNVDLIEMVFGQVSLTAKLIEKNNLLYELQMKNSTSYAPGEVTLN